MKPTKRLLVPILIATLTPLIVTPVASRGKNSPVPERMDGRVRIGVSGDPVKRRVFAEGGIVVRDPAEGKPIWKRRFDPGVYLVSANSSGLRKPIFRVQVASFITEELAMKKKAELESLLPREKVILAYHPDRHAWRVRVGEVRSRAETTHLVQRLKNVGETELWVTEEEEEVTGKRRIRLVDA